MHAPQYTIGEASWNTAISNFQILEKHTPFSVIDNVVFQRMISFSSSSNTSHRLLRSKYRAFKINFGFPG